MPVDASSQTELDRQLYLAHCPRCAPRSLRDSVVERTERELELLREYHTRLIADVVTGKLDVCEAASKLPDVEEVEPKDILEADSETMPEEFGLTAEPDG